jgi:ribosomal protein L21E
MRKFPMVVAAVVAVASLATPAVAAGKGKGNAPTPAASSTPSPQSTVGAAKRVEITVTGVVVGTPTAEDSVTVKVKTVPQGKNKLLIAKGATITVKRNTSGKTAFTLKRNGQDLITTSLTQLKDGDKVTVKLVSQVAAAVAGTPGTPGIFAAQSITANGN